MRPVSCFGLEAHPGAYETWPLRTRLLRDGKATGHKVPGYEILHQFELDGGEFLLVTDWDCPFEEATELSLLGPNGKVESRRTFGSALEGFYGASWLLLGFEVTAKNGFNLDFGGDHLRSVTVRPKTWWNRLWRFQISLLPRPASSADGT